ncbi:MAG: recombinase family protein [Gaiellaceae bacterium]
MNRKLRTDVEDGRRLHRVSRVGGRKGESSSRRTSSARRSRRGRARWERRSLSGTDLDQSGGTLDRPGFTAALERCRTGQTGGIAAAKLDRLTRSVAGLASLLDDAKAHGFNLVALDLGEASSGAPDGTASCAPMGASSRACGAFLPRFRA